MMFKKLLKKIKHKIALVCVKKDSRGNTKEELTEILGVEIKGLWK